MSDFHKYMAAKLACGTYYQLDDLYIGALREKFGSDSEDFNFYFKVFQCEPLAHDSVSDCVILLQHNPISFLMKAYIHEWANKNRDMIIKENDMRKLKDLLNHYVLTRSINPAPTPH